MEMKHTPGPWTISANGYDPRTQSFLFRFNADGEKGKAVDDCRLLAAAPELLSACKAALNGGIDTNQSWSEVCDELRAAIVKAEGERITERQKYWQP